MSHPSSKGPTRQLREINPAAVPDWEVFLERVHARVILPGAEDPAATVASRLPVVTLETIEESNSLTVKDLRSARGMAGGMAANPRVNDAVQGMIQ